MVVTLARKYAEVCRISEWTWYSVLLFRHLIPIENSRTSAKRTKLELITRAIATGVKGDDNSRGPKLEWSPQIL